MKLKLKKPIKVAEASLKKSETEERENFESLFLNNDSLSFIYNTAKEINNESNDYIVKKAGSSNFQYNNNNGESVINFQDANNKSYTKGISDYALSQLCNKIGIPFQYIKRCLKSGKNNLVEDNINSWLYNYGKDFLIREYSGYARGVLTPRYSIFDSHEILEVLGEEFPIDSYDIKGYHLSPERFHIRFVSNNPLNITNEDLFPGISIDSSDVGRSHLKLNFFIWKQVCSNGLIVPKKFGVLYTKRHMGIQKDDFKEELKHSLDIVEPLIAKVTDSIINTANLSIEDVFTDEQSLDNLIKTISSNTGIKENGANKVIDLMVNEVYPKSRWGLINSLTQVAQDYTLEKRLDIEKFAGELLVA